MTLFKSGNYVVIIRQLERFETKHSFSCCYH